jgi:hypothetical protein
VQGWSPECLRGVQGIAVRVKQWQAGVVHPPGQLHSEQRWRQTVFVRQQNHSPEVVQVAGQPPPCWQVLQGYDGFRLSQSGAGEPQGLHGPPPQPTQLVIEPSVTLVPVRKSPAPSDPAVRNLTN